MRITVRGWGRDQGETVLMSAGLGGAQPPGDRLSRGELYKRVLYPEDKRLTKVRILRSAEMRLGGTYVLQVELSRKEIAQLFFETHTGAMVRMIQSFIEDEEKEDRALELERRRKRMAALAELAKDEDDEP